MHLRILKGEASTWYIKDILLPLLISLGIGVIARLLVPRDTPFFWVIAWSGISTGIAILAIMCCLPWMRAILMRLPSMLTARRA